MKNKIQTFDEKEPPITSKELLAEIKPLLDDYFIGDIFIDKNGILYKLPNGQTFLLNAELVS